MIVYNYLNLGRKGLSLTGNINTLPAKDYLIAFIIQVAVNDRHG